MRTDDLLTLAKKLAPHSLRLRAFLGVMALNVYRNRMGAEAFNRLPELVEEAMAELGVNEWGEFAERLQPNLPEPQDFRQAVRWMRHEVYVRSAAYQGQGWRAERAGGDPGLLAWIDRTARKFALLGVPVLAKTIVVTEAEQNRLFVQGLSEHRFGQSLHNHGRAVELVHGLFDRDLPPACWTAISQVGFQAANWLDIELEWGGDHHPWCEGDRPWLWLVVRPGGDEGLDFVAPGNWSRSPPGERDRLLRDYGLVPK